MYLNVQQKYLKKVAWLMSNSDAILGQDSLTSPKFEKKISAVRSSLTDVFHSRLLSSHG